jgi:hypothetical protein
MAATMVVPAYVVTATNQPNAFNPQNQNSRFRKGELSFVGRLHMIMFMDLKELALNIVVEWLAYLILVQEVPDSNLSLQTGCPD